MTRMKYRQEHWDEYIRLMDTGLSGSAALRKMGIPKGSLGNLKVRFNGTEPSPSMGEPSSSLDGQFTIVPGVSQSIGGLARLLTLYTESMLDLTAQLSELTKHAHGLALLDKTLGQLEAKQQESGSLRRQLEDAEKRLISRAMVVHSND